MLCTHKTASSASLVLEICPQSNNSFLNQFSSISGGNCITYPHVLLTGPHEWDPSVLVYTKPITSGDPTWAPDPSQCGAHDPRIDDFGNFMGRVQHTLMHCPALSNIAQHKHAITTQSIDFEMLRPYFGWVNKHTIEKTFHKTTQWAVASTRYPISNPDSQPSTSLGDLKRLPLIPSSLIHLPLTQVSQWPRILLEKEL